MPALLFTLCNAVVVPAWLLLLFAPRNRAPRQAASVLLPGLLAILYLGFLVTSMWTTFAGGLGAISTVQLLTNPWFLLAAWVHILAFDLFIAGWQIRDGRRRNIPTGIRVCCLGLTCWCGPVGLAAYLVLRNAGRTTVASRFRSPQPWRAFTDHLRYKPRLRAITRCRAWIRTFHRRERLLTTLAVALVALTVPLLVLSYADVRTVMGENVWVKPTKFAASFGIYAWSLAWLLRWVVAPRPLLTAIRWITTLCLVVEQSLLMLQAARGVPSHYNESTIFDQSVFYGIGIAAFTQLGALLVTGLLLRSPRCRLAPLCRWAAVAGIGCALAAIIPGMLMISRGQHSVTARTQQTAAVLPAGDLRVSHFLCLHGLQVLPAAGLLFQRGTTRYSARRLWSGWLLVAGVYGGLILWTLCRALLGQPANPWLSS